MTQEIELKPPKNDREALTLALVLGITALTDEDFNKARNLAEELATQMTETEIARCKRAALRVIQRGPTHV